MAKRKALHQLTPMSRPSDIDADSTMHSSDDEMFPDEALPNNPSTPLNASLQTLAASELSPPNSQGGPSNGLRDTSSLSSAVNANGKRPLSLVQSGGTKTAAKEAHTDAETGYSWTKQEDQPGYEWKNSRAREDESRALDNIIDQGAQIKGDYIFGEETAEL